MKKIILTLVLSSFLPAIAVAADKTMHNDNPNTSVLKKGKHMTNSNPNTSVMEKGKHMMMGDNPYSSHPTQAKAKKTKNHSNKGYTVIKYKK
ncbi:hypothetical protein [Methyloprofundus sp.]|uniref:hypothetical protein n=1 Tax=Methyloprofundus sp. TaxID=2020875 RepID=UPI003D14043F